MEIHVNLNDPVKVILTKEGAEALNKYNKQRIAEYLNLFPKADIDFLKVDYSEGETVKDSLWHLFALLGDYLYGNTSAPFKNNEIVL